MRSPSFILHIPDASTIIPPEVRGHFVLSDGELHAELLRMTDWYTDELFAAPDDGFCTMQYPVSRLVVDPERFEDDAAEVMVSRGMGVIYTRIANGSPLRRGLTPGEREALLAEYYRPHHRRLTVACAACLEHTGQALIIDCHSFPSRRLPYELDQRPDRPDICLGTDDYHTPPWLVDRARELFEAAGMSVAINRPFAGALVPMHFYRKEPKVRALLIEVRRGLYMDEGTGHRGAAFSGAVDQVRACLAAIADQAA